MLDEILSLYFGMENLWSAIDLDRLGPVGIELGKVKRRVNKANKPTRTRRKENRRGANRNTGNARCFGIFRPRRKAQTLLMYRREAKREKVVIGRGLACLKFMPRTRAACNEGHACRR